MQSGQSVYTGTPQVFAECKKEERKVIQVEMRNCAVFIGGSSRYLNLRCIHSWSNSLDPLFVPLLSYFYL